MQGKIEISEGAITTSVTTRHGSFFFTVANDGAIRGCLRAALTGTIGKELDGAQAVISAYQEFAELVFDREFAKVESARGWAHGWAGSRRSAIFHYFGTVQGNKFVSLCGKSQMWIREGRLSSPLKDGPAESRGGCKVCIRELESQTIHELAR